MLRAFTTSGRREKMYSKSHSIYFLALLFFFTPMLSMADSRMCAADIRTTQNAGLIKAYRTFRGECSSYQGCVQKVAKSANTALSCRSSCATKSNAAQKVCVSTCLGREAKSSDLRKKIDQSCGRLRSDDRCKKATLRFEKTLVAAGKSADPAKGSCAIFMGKK